jgi:D-amino peptidase
MRIYLMTDLEGACGVLDAEDWASPGGRFNDEARRLLTLEVNAAVDGFYSAGATSVMVVDGHASGGIDMGILDRRTLILRGFPGPYPWGMDRGFDAMAWVGQHAKAGADHAHLPHTGEYGVLDCTVNGTSVGELGMMALCGAFFGVPAIFASGDEALCREARALLPAIETASVKRGLAAGSGDELDAAAYRARNASALHLHPEKARELIRNGATAALARLRENREGFPLLTLEPPFVRLVAWRRSAKQGKRTMRSEHAADLPSALNGPGAEVRAPAQSQGRPRKTSAAPSAARAKRRKASS